MPLFFVQIPGEAANDEDVFIMPKGDFPLRILLSIVITPSINGTPITRIAVASFTLEKIEIAARSR